MREGHFLVAGALLDEKCRNPSIRDGIQKESKFSKKRKKVSIIAKTTRTR